MTTLPEIALPGRRLAWPTRLASGKTNGSIKGMTAGRKVKISISLDADLLGIVDRRAAEEGATRSAVMERWLRQVSHRNKLARLEEETASYYDALTESERQEDASWAAASSKAARGLRIDEAPTPGIAASSRRSGSRRRS
jgi:hypothetical protein